MEKIRNSRISLLFFLLFIFVFAGCSEGQLSKTYTVGVVNLNKEHDKVFLGFKKGLTSLGYIEGKNITFIYNGSRSKMPDLVNDLQSLINQKVDLILSITTPATKKTKKMTAGTGIPVVFAPVFDPVESGIVQSLVKPGGNLTGIKVGGHSGKALDWLLKIAPDIKNISVPFNSKNRATVQSLQGLQQTADKVGVTLAVNEVDNKKELALLFEKLPDKTDALWLLNSHFLVKNTKLFVDAAIKYGLPLGSSTSQVDEGVMVTYGQNTSRTGELAAGLADKILQGVSPASLPVEITDFFLGINLKTANSIGIDISDDILHVADTIIRP
jgi:putative tryptophan/tyrosine transport system substrate-binding protein